MEEVGLSRVRENKFIVCYLHILLIQLLSMHQRTTFSIGH